MKPDAYSIIPPRPAAHEQNSSNPRFTMVIPKLFKMRPTAATLVAVTILAAEPAQVSAQTKIRLFLGPVPGTGGYTAPQSKDFQDSYRDIRVAYAKEPEFQSELELVSQIDQADLALEITSRDLRDTGERHEAPTVIVRGKKRRDPDVVVPGAITPITEKTLSARLIVLDSDYEVDLYGRARKGTYRKQAKDILEQVVNWVRQNGRILQTP
jgi:hypothetical protein